MVPQPGARNRAQWLYHCVGSARCGPSVFCQHDGCHQMNAESRNASFIRKSPETPPRPVKAVIFDFDGTLVDSEPNYYVSDRAMMLSYGIDLTEELKREFIGVGAVQMMQVLRQRFGIAAPVSELVRIKDEFYLRQAVGNTVVYPQMLRLVRTLHAAGIPMAVASGSTPMVLDTLMVETGLRPYFSAVVSASEVPRSKPFPDIFLEAARRLGVESADAAVFEDAVLGVRAGLAAGMRTCAIPGFPEDDLAPAYLDADLLFPGGMSFFSADVAMEWLGVPHP